jgi:hypothetical protein
MSIKSVLAADSRFQVAMQRARALEAAKGRCKLYSEEWYSLRDMLDEQHKIISSCTAATGEASGMKYTSEGDFCHLSAVGSVTFNRSNHYA